MANRNFQSHDRNGYTQGVVDVECSVIMQGTGAPTGMRGNGVASVAYVTTGVFLVTLSDGFRYVIRKDASVEDLASGSSPDGAYATVSPALNEATAGTPISFNVYTRAAGGTLTNYTGRRLEFTAVLKNSSVGI